MASVSVLLGSGRMEENLLGSKMGLYGGTVLTVRPLFLCLISP